MFISFVTRGVAAIASVVVCTSVHAAIVDTFTVGSGDKSASIQIDFENGNGYLINYSWSASAQSSWDAMLAVDAALPNMSMLYDTYSFGVFLTGVTIGADTNYGQGDVEPYENYWHLWIKDSAQWEQAMFGASDRNLVNGASDAWVFGSSNVPQNIPAPGAGRFCGVVEEPNTHASLAPLTKMRSDAPNMACSHCPESLVQKCQ